MPVLRGFQREHGNFLYTFGNITAMKSFVLSCWFLFGVTSSALAQNYRFDIDRERTFTDGYLQIRYWTTGQIQGDFDADQVPKGSRTLRGLDGAATPSANDEISVSPIWDFFRSAVFRTDGVFELNVDTATGKATVENYQVERLADGPVNVNARCTLNNEPFRTLAPAASVGEALAPFELQPMVLDRLRITQKPGKRVGTVTPMEDGWYRVSVTFMADVLIDVLELGQSKPLEFVMAASLVGDFRKTRDGAEFAYVRGQGGDNLTRDVNTPLEEFSLLVPIDKEQKARVRMKGNAIKRVSFQINGLRQMQAFGEEVAPPQPPAKVPPIN